ncbi:MAG TPA: hypothetical protein VNX18_14210 [Bryobacteraceae bacterium]|jgi:hypothetical protein|nr:hypothetical protein [Bryobacteraceae bacterium]
MNALIHQRCWNHASREAVVRCPSCQRYFCRECVTEHRGRMMCSACVTASVSAPAPGARSRGIAWAAFAAAGLLLAWMFFYYLGAMLARIPSNFFEKPA